MSKYSTHDINTGKHYRCLNYYYYRCLNINVFTDEKTFYLFYNSLVGKNINLKLY